MVNQCDTSMVFFIHKAQKRPKSTKAQSSFAGLVHAGPVRALFGKDDDGEVDADESRFTEKVACILNGSNWFQFASRTAEDVCLPPYS